jgi:hypothetical protein
MGRHRARPTGGCKPRGFPSAKHWQGAAGWAHQVKKYSAAPSAPQLPTSDTGHTAESGSSPRPRNACSKAWHVMAAQRRNDERAAQRIGSAVAGGLREAGSHACMPAMVSRDADRCGAAARRWALTTGTPVLGRQAYTLPPDFAVMFGRAMRSPRPCTGQLLQPSMAQSSAGQPSHCRQMPAAGTSGCCSL